jgi:hypothetical protein
MLTINRDTRISAVEYTILATLANSDNRAKTVDMLVNSPLLKVLKANRKEVINALSHLVAINWVEHDLFIYTKFVANKPLLRFRINTQCNYEINVAMGNWRKNIPSW